MKKNYFKPPWGILIAFSLFVFSCGSNEIKDLEEISFSSAELDSLSALDTIYLILSSDDKMQFDQSELIVFEGQTVFLTLIHMGTMPVTAMGHNFVLLMQGTSLSHFAKKALKAEKNDYIPMDNKDIIAFTDMIGGGESTSISFKAPKKGVYDFLCTFPGHYEMMKGKFIVK